MALELRSAATPQAACGAVVEEYRGETLSDQRPTTLTSTRPGLASSATVWGHKKIGSADLVETFSHLLLCLHPQRRPCALHHQVGLTVKRETTENKWAQIH